MNMSVKLIRRAAFALGAVAVAASLAACGSSNTTSSGASAVASATSTTTASAAGRSRFSRNPAERARLVTCLKQHGVTLPARPPAGYGSGGYGGGGGGFFGGGAGADSKVRSAMKACGVDYAARRGITGAQRRTDVTRFVTCVKQHRYTLPKPNFSGHGPVFPAKVQSNSKFQAAAKSCASLLRPPGPPQGAPGGPPPPSAA